MTRHSVSSLVYAASDRLRVPARVQRRTFAGELTIVMYHGLVRHPLPIPDWCFIEEHQFSREMRYLARHTQILPLPMALEQMRNGSLSEPSVAITFDDGFQSVHDVALPILQELSLPATVFLVTGLVDTSRTVWFCELMQLLATTKRTEMTWRGDRYDLRGRDALTATSARLQATLKELDPDSIRDGIRHIQSLLGVEDREVQEVFPQFRMLDRASIKRMAESGLVDFGAHTETHSILSRLSPDRARLEVQRSVGRTAELAETPCRLFAYPNGREQDYDALTLAELKRAGISDAVTTIHGPNTRHTPALELRRYGIEPGTPLGKFAVHVHHLPSRLTRWK